MKQNVVNDNGVQENVELSRRGFFGRLALGAVLSIAMPGIAHAAKSAAVKEDKKHRLASSAKSAVRLPKSKDHKAAKASHHKSSAAFKTAKSGKTTSKNGHLQTAHLDRPNQHGNRVRDVYTGRSQGKNQAIHHAVHTQKHGEAPSIIRPMPKEVIATPQEPLFLADRGRLATHRSLVFENMHTGEKLGLTYFEKGRYLNDALNEISYLLRDHRTGDVHPIDPELLDQLHDLKQILGLNQPFAVICGYRSPLTNAKLHAEQRGVANNSFHMYGKAVDIRIERFDLRRIHNAAIAMHRGGVGYYPDSNFIHLDTGTFRTWSL